jgi:putative ABC transport system substrate-binding protein
MIKRRTFIAGLGSAAAWPVVARAQQAAVSVVGLLGIFDDLPPNRSLNLNAFRKGLSETGYVEGQNVSIEYRGTGGVMIR